MSTAPSPRSLWRPSGATLCAIAVALVPKCPACWSVYAGLSSLLGLSISLETRFLLPLTLLSLGAAVGFLAVQARRGRGFGPLLLGSVAALVVALGKFSVDSDALTVAGLAGLLIAAFWSRGLARRRVQSAARVTGVLKTAQ